MTHIPKELQSKIEREAGETYPPDWAQGVDHNCGSRNGYISAATKYAEQAHLLAEALQKIDKECARHDTTAWNIACEALDNYEAWQKGRGKS